MRSPESGLYHYTWTERRQTEPPESALNSPLLALHASSPVDPLLPEQVRQARQVLRSRAEAHGVAPYDLQRQVVRRFLAGRAAYYGAEQCVPLDEAAQLASEGRDVFLIVKFMDEAPHLEATLRSLLNQADVELGRVVIVAVDNNSTDGSDQIVKQITSANRSRARIIYISQAMPGAGHAARLGVDRSIATVLRMCEIDGNWARLQNALIAVSDGDTVYHPHVLRETLRIFDDCPTVDAVMPFLTYKLTAALRLFGGYRPALPDRLARSGGSCQATDTQVSLDSETAFERLPRWLRQRRGDDVMELGVSGGGVLAVPLCHADDDGRRFGVLRDPAGRLGYVLADRTLVLAEAPMSGSDAALVTLENGGIRRDEKWRWHALIGHDLFLHWLFAGLGVPEEAVYPDTSDALKTVRAWAFAIGGQHQLRRPGLRIVTGSDYQSGRVLQAVGAVVRLGPAAAMAQTEIDRLSKMVRNLVGNQAVFYGNIRSTALERASGLYVHMTRIQGDIEEEVRGYGDDAFLGTVFPERLLFLLRWLIQNLMRFYAHDEDQAPPIVADRALVPMFGAEQAAAIERDWFAGSHLDPIRDAGGDERLDVAELLAERFIQANYPKLIRLYENSLRDYFTRQRVAAKHYEWLLEGLDAAPNAIALRPRDIDPSAVWDSDEFVIDIARGQVLSMQAKSGTQKPAGAGACPQEHV
jgi:Glycosyltransferase like family 2